MATKEAYFLDIKKDWYVTYFFQTKTKNDYTVKIQDRVTGEVYAVWNKPHEESNDPARITGGFLYTGSNGNLICTVDCPESSHLDNDFNGNLLSSLDGANVLGSTYFVTFEDNTGTVTYNDLVISLGGFSS
jgi:hypothetical protein